ncbi:MAG: four helix bundle protein [Flavobacteriales bacterium]|nr:four helix bundle protein [Flavobacteriales bacterium]
MFDFEKLKVYHKAKAFNQSVQAFLKDNPLDRITTHQLHRASFSIMLNIAEGSGRFTPGDKKNFYIIARGSVFECAAIFDFLKGQSVLSEQQSNLFRDALEELLKMLFSMIQRLTK